MTSRMSMTPLQPRELGGLKGFGFTVTFEDTPSAVPHPADTGAVFHPPKPSAAPVPLFSPWTVRPAQPWRAVGS